MDKFRQIHTLLIWTCSSLQVFHLSIWISHHIVKGNIIVIEIIYIYYSVSYIFCCVLLNLVLLYCCSFSMLCIGLINFLKSHSGAMFFLIFLFVFALVLRISSNTYIINNICYVFHLYLPFSSYILWNSRTLFATIYYKL